jgi:hypothetical protein
MTMDGYLEKGVKNRVGVGGNASRLQSRLSAWVNNGNGEESSSFISTLISCIKPPRNMLTDIAMLPSSFDV